MGRVGAVGWFLLIFVTRDLGAVVGEAAESVVCDHVRELLAGGEIAIAGRHFKAGTAAHVASKDAHLEATDPTASCSSLPGITAMFNESVPSRF